jgi:hypothetical protein
MQYRHHLDVTLRLVSFSVFHLLLTKGGTFYPGWILAGIYRMPIHLIGSLIPIYDPIDVCIVKWFVALCCTSQLTHHARLLPPSKVVKQYKLQSR